MELNKTDQIISHFNQVLNTLFVAPKPKRPFPATTADDGQLTDSEKNLSARYMRVNHAGEVCAQALYQSQSLTERDEQTKQKLQQSAQEENDHLAWCEKRIVELGGRTSLLNPAWYAGSFMIGTIAGLAGRRWNLGFLAETERQVASHLESHLTKLPTQDKRSREVITQMKLDEQQHATQAINAGASELPPPIKSVMQLTSKVMTNVAYWI